MRPRILDLFCGAGGAAKGYHDAGFDVTGVDIAPQPRYPYTFVQADALEYVVKHGHAFDVIHASPPCQAYSVTRTLHTAQYPRLIAVVRALLEHSGKPFVIENVEGAWSEMPNAFRLCGSSFGLGVRRHRLFDTSLPITFVVPCAHYLQPEPVDVTGTGGRRSGPRLDGRGGNSRKPLNLAHAREVMGIDWMTRTELAESIPPAFTEWIGARMLEHITEAAA